MQHINIRQANHADCALLSLIGASTFAATYPHIINAADMLYHCTVKHSAAAYCRYLDDGARAWLVEERSGAPVGYMLLTLPDLPIETGPRDLELLRIYLLAPYQGTGLAQNMMQTVLDAAKDAGADRLFLGVYQHNEKALGYYHKMGFSIVGERGFVVGETHYRDHILARHVRA